MATETLTSPPIKHWGSSTDPPQSCWRLQPWELLLVPSKELSPGSQDAPWVPNPSQQVQKMLAANAGWAAWPQHCDSSSVSSTLHVLVAGMGSFQGDCSVTGALHVHICLKQDVRQSNQSRLRCTAKHSALAACCIWNTFKMNHLPETQTQW